MKLKISDSDLRLRAACHKAVYTQNTAQKWGIAMKKQDTISLAEHFAIFGRAVKMVFRMDFTCMLCITLEAFFSSIMPYIPIYFSAKLIDAIYAGKPVKILGWYAALAVGIVFLLNVLITWIRTIKEFTYENLYRAEQWMYSEKEMDMEYSCIENRDVALLRERIRMETQTGYNRFYLHNCIEKFTRHITSIAVSLSMAMSFFLLDAVPLYMKLALAAGIIITVICGVYGLAKSEEQNQLYYTECVYLNIVSEKYSDCMQDYNMGMDIRLYGMSEQLVQGIAKYNIDFYRRMIKKETKQILFEIPVVILNHILKFGTYMILVMASIAGAVSLGSIAKYVSCIMLLLDAVMGLVSTLQRSFVNDGYLKRYFSYFDIPNNMYQGSLTVEKRLDNEYYVEFKDVSFRYPNTEIYALRHINIKFKIGEKIAVVGMNGSGKTTFVKLLCRLYDPTEGEILLNGVNIKKYAYDEYMSIFSIVFQDFQLFSFTIGQNVAAAEKYDKKRAADCLYRAGLGQRLDKMPDGTETFLFKDYAENGIEISGGEAQKIALARALYKDAPFLILDEPTAALDPVSEYEVYSKFNELAGDKTAVYISHRLASCRFCDNILVFDNGAVIQSGSHNTLLADRNGKYYELWNAQAQYYTDADKKENESNLCCQRQIKERTANEI